MQGNRVCAVARKELGAYFSSPVAFLFLGVFLVISMFVFFWVENFFARNIADVRPLFDWMPVLLIFLVASLTMRMWSEERRSGTLEFLLTAPVKISQLVIGKFSACLALVAIALALTFVLPVSVSVMGDLDWGPVGAGYVGALLVAGVYTAVGLFVSSRSDNQIVSLIVTMLICAALYLIGSQTISPLVGNRAAELFGLIGTGSRFESIGRGMLDLRDVYYYISLIAVFLVLNVLSLEQLKWSKETKLPRHSRTSWLALLLILNFMGANLWLHQVRAARVDLTKGKLFTVSPATKSVLAQLEEPLVIRGYFSAKTHPLLAPLVPQIRDLFQEYQIAGQGKVRAEFIDPRENPELEEEANQKYSIKPVPFQIEGKYEASLVNSYFDVLIKYGDKYEVLPFQELIEVKPGANGQLEVQLRNLEYDLTRSIKKVLYGFQGKDALFANMKTPVEFVGYVSGSEKLPPKLREFKDQLESVLQDFNSRSQGKLNFKFVEPEADGGKAAQEIVERYNFRPMIASLLEPQPFYFYMVLKSGEDNEIQLALPETLNKEGAEKSLEAGLKRYSRGFLKTVGLHLPPVPPQNPYMQQFMGPQGKHFNVLTQKLSENYSLRRLDLEKGVVPEDIDLLVLAAPDGMTEKQVFAVDQFLMRGGTIVLATSPFSVVRSRSGLNVEENKSGLEDWLGSHGLSLEKKFVLDPQSEYYPVPYRRTVAGYPVEEIVLKEYPYFVAVRDSGMQQQSQIVAGLPQVTLNWPSPISIDKEKNKDRSVQILLNSSPSAWLSGSKNVAPNYQLDSRFGVLPEGKRDAYPLAVMSQGVFESFFKDKDSPLAKEEAKPESEKAEDAEEEPDKASPVFSGKIDRSPESARIVLFSSNEFLTDEVLQIAAMVSGSGPLNSVQLIENTVDFALADPVLLSIRARARFSRTLQPMSKDAKLLWEYGVSYGGSLAGLLLVFLLYRLHRRRRALRYKNLLNG